MPTKRLTKKLLREAACEVSDFSQKYGGVEANAYSCYRVRDVSGGLLGEENPTTRHYTRLAHFMGWPQAAGYPGELAELVHYLRTEQGMDHAEATFAANRLRFDFLNLLAESL